jgi:hypothetical protein
VIHELDESLRTLVRRDAVPGNDIDVVFDAPTKEWASRRNSPAVDLYLYDIREDLRRRQNGVMIERDEAGAVVGRHQTPRWFKLSYLITAWTQRPEDEHRLLAGVLAAFLRRDCLPQEVLSGSLAELDVQIPFTCGLPPPEDRALSDVWSALGGELKPSIDLVVIAPFDLVRDWQPGPPVQFPLGLDLTDGAARDEPTFGSRPGPQSPSTAAAPTQTTTRPARAPSRSTPRKKR